MKKAIDNIIYILADRILNIIIQKYPELIKDIVAKEVAKEIELKLKAILSSQFRNIFH